MAEKRWVDPIVEENRRCREKHAERFNYDLKAICDDLRAEQAASGHKVVSFPPRRPCEHTSQEGAA